MKKTKFDVFGMTCSACQSHVQNAVEKLDGIKSVNVNLLTNSMVADFDEKICNEKMICESVENAGYRAVAESEFTSQKSDDEILKEKELI